MADALQVSQSQIFAEQERANVLLGWEGTPSGPRESEEAPECSEAS
jgi:hypothetical protein